MTLMSKADVGQGPGRLAADHNSPGPFPDDRAGNGGDFCFRSLHPCGTGGRHYRLVEKAGNNKGQTPGLPGSVPSLESGFPAKHFQCPVKSPSFLAPFLLPELLPDLVEAPITVLPDHLKSCSVFTMAVKTC